MNIKYAVVLKYYNNKVVKYIKRVLNCRRVNNRSLKDYDLYIDVFDTLAEVELVYPNTKLKFF